MQTNLTIQPIRTSDNPGIADIVKNAMREFGCDPATTVLGDPALDYMFEYYDIPRAAYYVASDHGTLLGGAGIRPLDGAAENVCELQRMFLRPEARGKGVGKQLMDICLQKAGDFGYNEIYLESFRQMQSAIRLYDSYGFKTLSAPMGATGHSGCDVWMKKSVESWEQPMRITQGRKGRRGTANTDQAGVIRSH